MIPDTNTQKFNKTNQQNANIFLTTIIINLNTIGFKKLIQDKNINAKQK